MSDRPCKCGHGKLSHWGRPGQQCRENIHPHAGITRGSVDICRCEMYVKAKPSRAKGGR